MAWPKIANRQNQGVLLDRREEDFARMVAEGKQPGEARRIAGISKWRTIKDLVEDQYIAARIETIKQQIARRAEMTYQAIIDRVDEEWRLASKAGQHSSALKAAEMLGGELHNMFTKKLEVGRAGEFDGMSEEELRDFIANEMKSVGMLVEHVQQITMEEEPAGTDNQIASKADDSPAAGASGNGELPAPHETSEG